MNSLNTLFILSDEHSRSVSGCYGHSIVKTPNIDRLAIKGTLFENAYCNSPICVPSRASIHTGKYVHQTRNWCNGTPYTGDALSWAHRLRETGHETVSIGKLHFRSANDDNGFSEEIMPLHVIDGIGDLTSCLRPERPERNFLHTMAENIGPGETSYQKYDSDIAQAACQWLREKCAKTNEKPWTLFVSFVCPHFPLIAPEAFYEMYDPAEIPLPKFHQFGDPSQHPVWKQMQEYINHSEFFTDDKICIALASYYGLVSFVDHQIGRILDTLAEIGLEDSTRIIYSSDHGDNLGTRGRWGKSTLYEESASVPLIIAGPDIENGKRVNTPVSLVDLAPTLIEFNDGKLTKEEARQFPGVNLTRIAAGEFPDRSVLSEYHAIGSVTGSFMIRYLKWKYIYHVGYECQLFNLDEDPEELQDLGTDPAYLSQRDLCHGKLLEICDPEKESARAFEDQAAKIEEHGGIEAVLKRKPIAFTPAPKDGNNSAL